MLRTIVIVTITASNLAAVEQAYREYLGYEVVERGTISRVLASVWGTPAAIGRPYLLLQPPSGEKVYLRFVQAEPTEGYAPLRTVGWNCTELLVQDVDDLAKKLENSPFQILGPPRNLSSNENIRAMQVLGPANEVLYLTRLKPGQSGFNLGSAKTYVDRVFVVVLGSKDLQAALDFYAQQLKLPVTQPMQVRISVLSKAYGMDPERMHKLALAQLPGRFLIEIDEYPESATRRPQRAGDLPPGMAMVSFEVDSLDALKLEWIRPPIKLKQAPYHGRRAAIVIGAAGEWIELIEAPVSKEGQGPKAERKRKGERQK